LQTKEAKRDQFAAEYGALASTLVQQEHCRTNKLALPDYLDTVEVIGSIPVEPIESITSAEPAVERYPTKIQDSVRS
jgi:hypothetical protein